jgi:hypothetical protein
MLNSYVITDTQILNTKYLDIFLTKICLKNILLRYEYKLLNFISIDTVS